MFARASTPPIASFASKTTTARKRSSQQQRNRATSTTAMARAEMGEASGLAPKQARANEIACVGVKSTKTPAAPAPNKFQEFGRQYWPAFAVLEGVALVGATVNGILSRKRREEIERLNAQMRGIMAKLDEREKSFTSASEDGDAEVSETLAAAKSALASDHNERAAQSFAKAIDLAVAAGDVVSEISARKGYAMSLAAQRQFPAAADALQAALERAQTAAAGEGVSAIYGLLGDVYTDMGAFDKAGDAYDACIRIMD